MGEFVEIETLPEKRIATLRLNRPPMNAISAGVVRDLGEAAELLSNNEDIAAVVIWGGPKIFAAGADIKEMPNRDPGEVPRSITEAFTGIAELTQITISAVNGYALGGGCELALCTDFRIAGDDAVFGQPEVLLGIIPGAGGTQRLPRIIGITKAKELMYTGRRVPAAEALEIGLADEVCPAAEAYPRALELAETYAKGPASLRNIKRATDQGFDLPMREALAIETTESNASFRTQDAKIGIQSFIEKGPGKATFTGR